MSESSLRVEYAPPFSDETSKNGPGRKGGPKHRRVTARRVGWYTVVGVVALILPFAVLVRLSVLAYRTLGLGSWPSLGVGALATVILLVVYAFAVRLRVQGKLGVPRTLRRGLLVLVGAYCAYALLYLSSANSKAPELQRHYLTLNPLIRVATSTVVLIDREAVITDVRRAREDYQSWGLPVNEASLHFEQVNGFVHALDLRTIGRPEWRNWALATYYRLMGFHTLRHVGTADHLHVSLPLP